MSAVHFVFADHHTPYDPSRSPSSLTMVTATTSAKMTTAPKSLPAQSFPHPKQSSVRKPTDFVLQLAIASVSPFDTVLMVAMPYYRDDFRGDVRVRIGRHCRRRWLCDSIVVSSAPCDGVIVCIGRHCCRTSSHPGSVTHASSLISSQSFKARHGRHRVHRLDKARQRHGGLA